MGEEAPAGLREQRKRTTRRALQSAALRLFARDGFDETTVEAIAAAAEVSGRTFFRYFGSKDEVLYVERERRQSLLRDALLATPASVGDVEAVHAALVAIAPEMDRDRELSALQQQAAATSPLLRGRMFDVLLSWERAIASALGERNGVAVDDVGVEVAAATGIAGYRTAVTRWLRDPGPGRPLAAHLDEVFAELTAVT